MRKTLIFFCTHERCKSNSLGERAHAPVRLACKHRESDDNIGASATGYRSYRKASARLSPRTPGSAGAGWWSQWNGSSLGKRAQVPVRLACKHQENNDNVGAIATGYQKLLGFVSESFTSHTWLCGDLGRHCVHARLPARGRLPRTHRTTASLRAASRGQSSNRSGAPVTGHWPPEAASARSSAERSKACP